MYAAVLFVNTSEYDLFFIMKSNSSHARSSKEMFKCVHCGASATELVVDISASLDTIELKSCDTCGKQVDHYLEYDVIIVVLDMVLMKPEAYRHMLFNTSFEKHWRMAVLIILVQGFFNWRTQCNYTEKYNTDLIFYDEKIYGSFLMQMSFFCFLSLAENAFLMLYFIMLLHCYWTVWPARKPADFKLFMFWKGIVLGSFQQFFLIAPLIWQMTNSEPHIRAIRVFHFLTINLIFSVICFTSWAVSAAIVGTGAVCMVALRYMLMSLLLRLSTSSDCDATDVCDVLSL